MKKMLLVLLLTATAFAVHTLHAQPLELGQAVTTKFTGYIPPFYSAPESEGPVVTIYDTRYTDNAPLTPTAWNTALVQYDPTAAVNPMPGGNFGRVGSVFGIAIESSTRFYVAASLVYSSLTWGTAGAGGIYRFDYNGAQWITTDFITTNVSATYNAANPNQMPNTGSSLGNICLYRDRLYATNMEDGNIYVIDLAGNIVSRYDPFTADTGTWGAAPLGERLFGIGAYDDRLYFCRYNGDMGGGTQNEIYSVALDPSGNVAAGVPVKELDVPLLATTGVINPVTDIEFGTNGRMLMAQRTCFGGSCTGAHNSTVYEAQEDALGNWAIADPNQFHIGYHWNQTNANGGTDYAYDFEKSLGMTGCETRIWATSDWVSGTTNYDIIYGMQGTPSSGGSYANSIGIDFFPVVLGTYTKTKQGDVDIFREPCEDGHDPCENVIASFDYTLEGNTINLTSTSPTTPFDYLVWIVDGVSHLDVSGSYSVPLSGTGQHDICMVIVATLEEQDTCCRDTLCITIGLDTCDIIDFNASFVVASSSGNTVTFDNTSSPAPTVSIWTVNGQSFIDNTGNDFVYTFPGPGAYPVCLKAIRHLDAAGTLCCIDVVCDTIVVGDIHENCACVDASFDYNFASCSHTIPQHCKTNFYGNYSLLCERVQILATEWYLNGVLVSTSDPLLNYPITLSGVQTMCYVVRYIVNGEECKDKECITIYDDTRRMDVSPNPVGTSANVTIGSQLQIREISLLSAQGKLLDRIPTTGSTTTINLDKYEKGIYFVHGLDENTGTVVSQKIVKM